MSECLCGSQHKIRDALVHGITQAQSEEIRLAESVSGLAAGDQGHFGLSISDTSAGLADQRLLQYADVRQYRLRAPRADGVGDGARRIAVIPTALRHGDISGVCQQPRRSAVATRPSHRLDHQVACLACTQRISLLLRHGSDTDEHRGTWRDL